MRHFTPLISLGALALLAGCSSYDPVLKAGSSDRKSFDIEVVEDTMVLELNASQAEPGLPYHQIRKVQNFMADYKSRGKRHGPLIVSVPTGSPFAPQYEQSVQETLNIAYDYGVLDVSRSDYDSNGAPEAPMILAFATFRAIPPNCPSLATINMAASSTSDPQPAFGCATQANLAMMVADPADLLGTRRADPVDTLRRAEVLTKYRAGESTATERGEQETGAISTAVE